MTPDVPEERSNEGLDWLSSLSSALLARCPPRPIVVLLAAADGYLPYLLAHALDGQRYTVRRVATAAAFRSALILDTYDRDEADAKYAPDHGIDLAIVCQQLEDSAGVDLVAELRAKTSELPVIFVADHGSESLMVKLWKLSVDDYLTTPVAVDELDERLERVIGKRQRIRELKSCLEADERAAPFILHDLYLINASGKLLYHHSSSAISTVDADIFSGMLTAVRSFLADSFEDFAGELQTIDYHPLKIVLESQPSFYLVLVGEGSLGAGTQSAIANVAARLSEHWGERIARWSGDPALVSTIACELATIVERLSK